MLDILGHKLNNSKLLLAFLIIIATLGWKHLAEELKPHHRNILDHWLSRKIIIFAIIFSSTNDIGISIFAILIYILFTSFN
jgi:hypothetical protein